MGWKKSGVCLKMERIGTNTAPHSAALPGDAELHLMNELDNNMMCPRCHKPVPVFIRVVESWDRFGRDYKKEAHCLKCYLHGHRGGSYIRDFAGI
jgi:hypothetical protein